MPQAPGSFIYVGGSFGGDASLSMRLIRPGVATVIRQGPIGIGFYRTGAADLPPGSYNSTGVGFVSDWLNLHSLAQPDGGPDFKQTCMPGNGYDPNDSPVGSVAILTKYFAVPATETPVKATVWMQGADTTAFNFAGLNKTPYGVAFPSTYAAYDQNGARSYNGCYVYQSCWSNETGPEGDATNGFDLPIANLSYGTGSDNQLQVAVKKLLTTNLQGTQTGFTVRFVVKIEY